MKKIIFSFLLISSSYSFAQSGAVLSTNDFAEGSVFSARISSQNAGRSLTYDEVTGSPYLTLNFSNAKIAENYENVPVRYNSYTDQIEFQRDGTTMILPKDAKFSRIEMVSPKQTLVSLETNDDLAGYFYEVVRGKNSLYKKIKTKYIDFVPAKSSYGSDKPAFFKTAEPVYYIKTENEIIKKPKNQKSITEALPAQKDALDGFFKANKIKFDKEEDLVKLVNFLNQN